MFLRILRRLLIWLLVIVGGAYLLYQAFLFYRAQDKFPPGTTVAGLAIEGLTMDQASAMLIEQYMSPLALYRNDQRVAELSPQDVGFVMDLEGMLEQARSEWQAQELWRRYGEFVIGLSPQPITVELRATHDDAALAERLRTVASFVDKPAAPPSFLSEAGTIEDGRPGYVTDIEASLPTLRDTLYQPDDRVMQLTFVEQPAPEWGIYLLENEIQKQLDSFEGFGSVFVLDLQTGEEVRINADVALSGLSMLKIPIFVETYRTLDQPPDDYVQGLLTETAIHSSNHSANLLLHVIAGENNTYQGADLFTEYMRSLGLVNTFMAVPYDAVAVTTRPSTYQTPANSREDINTNPDPTMQTTAEEIGTMLAMLYYCAQGEGGLLAAYPEQITQQECQAIVDLMVQNEEGNLIRYGVPENVPVSHKHGWSFNEHGDAGIVYSPNGDYVIMIYLAQPESDWLSSDYSFPIIREIARATYNYFNFDHPYLDSALDGIERSDQPPADPVEGN
jgi:beta-lactamase class A